MKSKWFLFICLFQLIVGTLGIAAFIVIWIGGEILIKWIGTLILSIAFIVLGIMGISQYKSER